MKNKKGFTLIELLAVIVILAIIMVIAVPQILNIIEETEKQAYKESVELMANAARIQYDAKQIHGSLPTSTITYTYTNGEQTSPSNITLDFKGDKPKSGTITIDENKKIVVTDLVSKNGKWCASKAIDGPVVVNKCDGSGGGSSSWDMYYTRSERSGTTEFNQDWSNYIRKNTTTGDVQVCAAFPNSTVCLVNSTTGYSLNGEYISTKISEMQNAGAECDVDYYYGSVLCTTGSVNCWMRESGDVSCGGGYGNADCAIQANGDFGC